MKPVFRTGSDVEIVSVDYKWKPKEDITAHELALCTPILVGFDNIYSIDALIDDLPDNARRHFEVVKG
jgi:hypothetical protein